MASLFTLMPAGAGPIPLERLEAAAETEDVLVDCLIDEELFWLRGDAATPDPDYDEPYLSSLSGPGRAVALDSGLRALIAKGMVDIDPDDPGSLEVLGVYALLAECRRNARSVTRAVLRVTGDPDLRYAFHRVSDTLVLVEEVSVDGFHDFAFQSLDSAAAALSSIFDRRRSAGADSGAHQRVDHVEDLDPTPEALVARAGHVVSVRTTVNPSGAGTADAELQVFGTGDGVWALWREGTGVVLARTGAPDLFVLAADAISARSPAS